VGVQGASLEDVEGGAQAEEVEGGSQVKEVVMEMVGRGRGEVWGEEEGEVEEGEVSEEELVLEEEPETILVQASSRTLVTSSILTCRDLLKKVNQA